MRWIIAGAKLFADNGFKMMAVPDAVAEATDGIPGERGLATALFG